MKIYFPEYINIFKTALFWFFPLLEVAPLLAKFLKTPVDSSCNKTVFSIMMVDKQATYI